MIDDDARDNWNKKFDEEILAVHPLNRILESLQRERIEHGVDGSPFTPREYIVLRKTLRK